MAMVRCQRSDAAAIYSSRRVCSLASIQHAMTLDISTKKKRFPFKNHEKHEKLASDRSRGGYTSYHNRYHSRRSFWRPSHSSPLNPYHSLFTGFSQLTIWNAKKCFMFQSMLCLDEAAIYDLKLVSVHGQRLVTAGPRLFTLGS